MSLGGGGWISRLGRAETNSEADDSSERRIVGMAFDERRTGFLTSLGSGAGGGGGGAGAGVGALKIGVGWNEIH